MKKIYFVLILGCSLHSMVEGMEKNNALEMLSSWWQKGTEEKKGVIANGVDTCAAVLQDKTATIEQGLIFTARTLGKTFLSSIIEGLYGKDDKAQEQVLKEGVVKTLTADLGKLKNKTVELVYGIDRAKALKEAGDEGILKQVETNVEDFKKKVIKDVKDLGSELKNEIRQESNRFLLKMFAGTALAITVYFASKLIWNRIERYLNKPKLDFKVIPNELNAKAQKTDPLDHFVLSEKATEQLKDVIEKTALTKKNILDGDQTCTYRGLMLYGPKGSGKRLFAQNFAQSLGMNFIDLSVASLTKYKEEADIKEAYDGLFQGVASNSAQGSIVFIDNAGILLSDRKPTDNTPLGRAIAALIDQVEQGSNRFMLILSLHTEDEPWLTPAMSSIIQSPLIFFEKPDFAARIKLLTMYADGLIAPLTGEQAELVRLTLHEGKIKEMAEKLEGATAKDVFEVMNSIKMDVLTLKEAVSQKSIEKIMKDKVDMIKKYKRPNSKTLSTVLA